MINFVVIEDKNEHRKNNVKLITNYMMSNKLEFDIYEFNDISDDVLKEISKFNENSVYIIDLQLPSGEGIDIARYIRKFINHLVTFFYIQT
jgi:DNA-binding LytR/AlgR family response regulator